MTREYFIVDHTGHISYTHAKNHEPEPESFSSIASATKRARVLAKSEPGQTITIARAYAYVTCEVQPATVEMRERKLRA